MHAVAPSRGGGEPLDAVTLTRKVETQSFRGADAPKGRVTVNAEGDVVFLRGKLGTTEEIDALVAAARGVDGVGRGREPAAPPPDPGADEALTGRPQPASWAATVRRSSLNALRAACRASSSRAQERAGRPTGARSPS